MTKYLTHYKRFGAFLGGFMGFAGIYSNKLINHPQREVQTIKQYKRAKGKSFLLSLVLLCLLFYVVLGCVAVAAENQQQTAAELELWESMEKINNSFLTELDQLKSQQRKQDEQLMVLEGQLDSSKNKLQVLTQINQELLIQSKQLKLEQMTLTADLESSKNLLKDNEKLYQQSVEYWENREKELQKKIKIAKMQRAIWQGVAIVAGTTIIINFVKNIK